MRAFRRWWCSRTCSPALNSNIRWTADLGNAFLAQQADVMNAIQRLRAQARAAGQLNSNTEETIATNTEGGQTAIEIQPTNPDEVYVPEYNPADVWGPPPYADYYPDLDYPDFGWGFGFYPGIYIGGFFGGLGWGGWGWGANWFNCSIFENGDFFHHYGFHGFGGRGFHGRGFGGRGFDGRATWAHNPEHRQGMGYPNQTVASRFGGSVGGRGRVRGMGYMASVNRSGFGESGFSTYRSSPSFNNGNTGFRSGNTGFSSGNTGYRSLNPGYRSAPSFAGRSAMGSFHSFGGGFRPSGGAFHSSGSFHASGGGFHGGGGGFRGGGFHSGRGRR